MIGSFNSPRWIVFQLLEKCNLQCKMCYEWGENGSYYNKKNYQLDIDVIKKVIKDTHLSKPYFELFGGEPLLYSRIDEVFSLIQQYGCKADMPTNGTLLEDHVEMLVEYEARRIWISIDGPEEVNDIQRGKGVYKSAINGLHKLHEEKKRRGKKFPMIGVSMIVTPLNYRYIEQFFIKDLNCSMLDWISIEFQLYTTKKDTENYAQILKYIFNVNYTGCADGLVRDIRDFKEIDINEVIRQVTNVKDYCRKNGIGVIGYPKTMEYENLKNFYTASWNEMKDKRSKCSFPWVYAEIAANGDVTPCHAFYDYTVGNVNYESIIDIWNGKKFEEYRKYTRKNVLPICTACSRYFTDL